MQGDLLGGGKPNRLFQRNGRWFMDYVRLSARGGGVFRPELKRVEGEQAILTLLGSQANARTLAVGADRLLRAPAGDRDRSFHVIDEDWVPTEAVPSIAKGLRASPTKRAMDSEVLELRAEVLVLRAGYERLRERVAALEALVRGVSSPEKLAVESYAQVMGGLTAAKIPSTDVSSEQTRALADASEREAPNAELPAGSDPAAKEREGDAAGAPSPAVESSSEAVDAASTGGAPAAESPGTAESEPVAKTPAPAAAAPSTSAGIDDGAPEKCLGLPKVDDVVQLLKQVVSDDVDATELDTAPDLSAASEKLHMSRLSDESGNIVGVLVADLKSVVGFGSALMMLPEAEVASQLEAAEPSADSIEAMGEVCSNMTSAINNVPGNPTVASAAVEPFDFEQVPWAANPRQRVAMRDSFGGVLLLVAR